MELLEHISFRKYPKKIFTGIVIAAIVIAVIFGVINWDTKKGVELYFNEMKLVSIPLQNYALKQIDRGQKIGKWLGDWVVPRLFIDHASTDTQGN